LTEKRVSIYSDHMEHRHFEKLTPENVESLFFLLMRGYKRSLKPEMSRSGDSDVPSVPVTFSLWALGSYLAAGDRSDVVDDDGEMLALDKFMVQALENGTNPNHPGYWAFGDSRSAKKIPEQAAAVAFAAWAARSLLFRRLSNQSVTQLEQWLENAARIKVKKRSYLSLAVALNHAARRGMGLRHDETVIESALEAVERCYLEEGWFADGGNGSRQFDDSVSWGYLSLLSALIYVEGGKRSAHYGTWEPRIRKTLRDFPYLYDPSGGTPEYGDTGAGSLARLAGPLAGYLIGAWPGKPGVLKRMVRLHLNRLLSRELIDSGTGRLNPPGGLRNDGAHYRAMQSIGFLLLCRGDDPFWKAREEHLPAERGDFVRFIASPGWMVHGAKQDGHVQLINGGSANENRRLLPGILPRYGKFCYSSSMGLVEDAKTDPLIFTCDNTLSASSDKKGWSHRDKISSCRLIGERILFTSGLLPVASARGRGRNLKTDTVIIPLRTGAQIRVHRIRRRGLGGGIVHIREGGYALGIEEGTAQKTSASGSIARAESGRGFSLVRILGGYTFAAISQGYEGRTEGHTLSSLYLLPRVETLLRPGETIFLALFLHAGTNVNLADSGDSLSFARKGDRVTLFSGKKSFFEYDFQSS
jgi:hypothetical protein